MTSLRHTERVSQYSVTKELREAQDILLPKMIIEGQIGV